MVNAAVERQPWALVSQVSSVRLHGPRSSASSEGSKSTFVGCMSDTSIHVVHGQQEHCTIGPGPLHPTCEFTQMEPPFPWHIGWAMPLFVST